MVISIDWFSGAMFGLPRIVRVPLRTDVGSEAAEEASGQCGPDTAATADRGFIPLAVPFDPDGNLLAPRWGLAADAEFRARLRSVNRGSPDPLAGPRPGAR